MSALGTMKLHVYNDIEQGTPEWLQLRAGIITASVIGQLITTSAPDALTVACPKCQAINGATCISTARKLPTPIKTPHDERAAKASTFPPVYSVADTDTARSLTLSLVAERITGHVVPVMPSRAMERGTLDEPYARNVYRERHAPVEEVGFMVRDFDGYKIGYSPDGLVGDDGLIEIKSREQKIQLKAFLDDAVPAANMAQMQTGLLVTGRQWCDYVSYSSGMPLYVKRVYPDTRWFDAIEAAAANFEKNAAAMIGTYLTRTANNPPTERIDHFAEMEIY